MKLKLFGRTLEIRDSSVSSLPSPWNDSGWSSYLAGKGYNVSSETALKIGAVFRCVDLVSKTMATLPLHLFMDDANGKVKAKAHPIYQLVHILPNYQTTAYEFWQMYIANLMLTRGGFAKIQRDVRGFIRSIWNIPTANVSGPYINSANGERYIVVSTSDGQSERLREGEFMFTPGFLLSDRVMPNDPMTIAGEILGLTNTLQEYAHRSVDGFNPTGFIEAPGELGEPAYRRLQEDYKKNYSGATNAGKLLILEQGMKAHTIDRDMEKMQVLESRKHAVTEICRVWGVPPHLCMDLEHATFSNIEHQSAEYVRDCINPMSVRNEQAMFRDLLSTSERIKYFFKFNTNALLRGDTATRTQYYNTMRQNGVFNADEIRELEDMAAIPDGQGKYYLVNGNMITLDNAAKNVPKGAQKGETQ